MFAAAILHCRNMDPSLTRHGRLFVSFRCSPIMTRCACFSGVLLRVPCPASTFGTGKGGLVTHWHCVQTFERRSTEAGAVPLQIFLASFAATLKPVVAEKKHRTSLRHTIPVPQLCLGRCVCQTGRGRPGQRARFMPPGKGAKNDPTGCR